MTQDKNSPPSQLWFCSNFFEITPGEDAETNPLCFGRDLAKWLAKRLVTLGYDVEEVIAEDWGWCVMCARKPFPLWIGCVNVHDYVTNRPDDAMPSGKDVVWSCMVHAEPSLFTKLLKRPDTKPSVDKLFGQVQALLRDEAKVAFVDEDGELIEADTPDASVQTVLCIPGRWADRTELIARIVEHGDGYLFAGGVLMHPPTQAMFELHVEPADPRMASAFRAAGRHWVDDDAMAAIAEHTTVLYLVGQGGSRERASEFMNAAAALLKAGGLGVKVESTGIAHTPQDWLDMTANQYLFAAYRAFVITITDSGAYSCGMHNFGLPDAIVDASASDDAAKLASTFSYYLFTEEPTIREGQTFSVGPDAPLYRLSKEPCTAYEDDSLFTNPFGMWRLTPV